MSSFANLPILLDAQFPRLRRPLAGDTPPLDPQAVADHSQDPHRNFIQNVGFRLRHAGKDALINLQQGRGLLGAAYGAVEGAISPQAADERQLNAIDYPRYQQRAEAQSQLADQAM